jgi:hypothetical protein
LVKGEDGHVKAELSDGKLGVGGRVRERGLLLVGTTRKKTASSRQDRQVESPAEVGEL